MNNFMESKMRVVTVSVSKHSSHDRSYAHDAWELLGENEHHWVLNCLTDSSWRNGFGTKKPHGPVFLEKQYYDIFDLPKNVADLAFDSYKKWVADQPPAECDYHDGHKYMQRIPAAEPVFVLRAQDKLASHFVRQWAVVAKDKGLSDARFNNAMKLADAMKAWPVKKLPD
jgi:hypothetical protein